MAWPEPVTLRGSHATLEPLTHARRDELIEAVRDGELWNLWYTFVPTPDKVEAEIERRLELQRKGTMVPFSIVDAASGKAAGMTSYLNIDAETKRLEIGTTWYRKSVQRTPMNTECKLLLLTRAFETLECIAVEFRTHWFNHASRAAIARLGAKQDGVLRNHAITADGVKRDTVVFSIIDGEWPAVRQHLRFQLEKPR